MRRRRFTIQYAMVAVAGLALALAALKGSSREWWIAAYLAMLAFFCWATLGAIVLGGADRPPWAGIAVFGWAFFILIKVDEVMPEAGLPIHRALQSVSLLAHPELPEPSFGPEMSRDEMKAIRFQHARQANLQDDRRSRFMSTLLVIVNVVFSLVGLIAGKKFAAGIERNIPASVLPAYTGHREESP